MGKYKRKRSLNSSSGSSNLGDISMNKSIAEEKSDVSQNVNTQYENQEIRSSAVCENTALEEALSEGNCVSDSDETVPNSFYNSSGNIRRATDKEEWYFESYCDSLARKRSQSLENRTKNGLTSPLITNTKSVVNENFLKVVPSRSLVDQRLGNDSQHLRQFIHPKKKIRTDIYKIPVFSNIVANEDSVKCINVSDKVVDEKCIDEKNFEGYVPNQDLNVQSVSDMKVIEMSNVIVVEQGEVIAIDKSILIPSGVTSNLVTGNVDETINKQITEPKNNSRSRPPLTEEQKKRFKDVQSRTVFIDGHKDDLRNYFKHMPRKLNKEIVEKSRGQVENVFITKQGILKIIANDEAQKKQLLKIQSLNDKPVKTSVPFALTHPSVSNKKPHPVIKHDTEYFVKGVVFGLLEDRENLDEIALEVGAHHISRLGNPEFSKASLIAYPKGTVLPQFLEVDGRRYKIHLYIPKPLRCDRCQFYGHRTDSCNRDVVCSRCSRNHSFVDCPNKNNLRCANCSQAHSAAYKNCPVFVKTQAALRIRAEQNITFAEAMAKVDEIQNQNVNSNVIKTNNIRPTYASKVKTGLENQTQTISTSTDIQTPIDVQIACNNETPPSDLVNRFLSFDKQYYKAINTCKSESDSVEDYDPVTKMKMSFVLAVLATIDKAKSRKHAQFDICHAASEIFFNNKIEFRYKDW